MDDRPELDREGTSPHAMPEPSAADAHGRADRSHPRRRWIAYGWLANAIVAVAALTWFAVATPEVWHEKDDNLTRLLWGVVPGGAWVVLLLCAAAWRWRFGSSRSREGSLAALAAALVSTCLLLMWFFFLIFAMGITDSRESRSRSGLDTPGAARAHRWE